MKDYTREVVYIGIDVHKKTYSVTAICNGTIAKRDTIAAYPEQLVNYIKKYFVLFSLNYAFIQSCIY